MSFDLSESDLQAQALNPAAPLEELLALAEDYPKEVLSNPVFDLLLVEDPDFLARMSGAAQLAILREGNCPDYVRSLFSLGALTIVADEHSNGVRETYDYDFDGAMVRVQAEWTGSDECSFILEPALLPYFADILQDEAKLEKRQIYHSDYPMTSAFLAAAVHHSDLAIKDELLYDGMVSGPPWALCDVGQVEVYLDAKSDTKYYVKPDDDLDDADDLNNVKYAVFDEDGTCYESGPMYDRLREIVIAFLRNYEDIRMDGYCRRIGCLEYEFHNVQRIILHCSAGSGSKNSVDISLQDFILLRDCLPVPQPEQIGVLVQSDVDETDTLVEEVDLLEGLDKVCDLVQLRAALADQGEQEDKVVDTFTELGMRILKHSSILGVAEPFRIEVLIRQSDDADPGLFGTVLCSDDDGSNFHGLTKNKRYRMECGEWLSLGILLEKIQEPGEFRDRFLFAVTRRYSEINLRMPASIPYIKCSVGQKFTKAVGLTAALIQCLPLTPGENLCILDGYQNGEPYIGLLIDGFCGGMFTSRHRSLEGTIWEGLTISGN
jgi:hypothetical protein